MKTNHYLYIILIAVFFCGCTEDGVDVEVKGTLSGTVNDANNSPLENVEISTNPASTTTTTDENGNFTIADILVDDYAVQAELDGFVTGFESVQITDGSITDVIFTLSESLVDNNQPSEPILAFPEDGAQDIPLEVEFIWDASDPEDDELTYNLQLRNGTTQEIRDFEVVADTSFVVSDLQVATNYFWEVTVDDGENDPLTSPISEFTTLTLPNNPFLFVRMENGNNVIYSGSDNPDPNGEPNNGVVQLTDPATNSFRPRMNSNVNRIAFLRTVGSDAQIFTMNFDGTDVQQVSVNVPMAGFKLSEIDFTWAINGGVIYYPNFSKLHSINPDGGFSNVIYETTDGSLISEVAVPDFDQDLVLLKTNDVNGYNVRIFTYRLSTGVEETIVLEGQDGAAGSIDITANSDTILYNWDVSGSENVNYRLFESRLFTFDVATAIPLEIDTDVALGMNDFDARFSPSEGAIIWARKSASAVAIPEVYQRAFQGDVDDVLLFTEAFMPDWD